MTKRSARHAQYALQGKHWSRTAPWSRTLSAAQSVRKAFIPVGLDQIVAMMVKMSFQKSGAEIICSYVHSTNTPATTATRIPRAPTQLSSQRATPTPFPAKEGEKITSRAFSTYSVEFLRSRIDQSITNTKSTDSPKEGSGNEVLPILSGVGGALGITFLFALIIAMIRHGWFCRPCFFWRDKSVQFPLAQIEHFPLTRSNFLDLGSTNL